MPSDNPQRVILTSDTIDGLAAALILKEAIGESDVRVCGRKEDRLHEAMHAVDEKAVDELWIVALAPDDEIRPYINVEQARLMNGSTWLFWLDHHYWPPKKKQGFRQYSKMKMVNDHRRQGFEVAASSCLPVPHEEEVLAVCAAMYRMFGSDMPQVPLLRAKLRSLSGKTAADHRAAEKWLNGFRPTKEALAALKVPVEYTTAMVPQKRLNQLQGEHGTSIVTIDCADGLLDALSVRDRRELLIETQIGQGAYGAVLLLPKGETMISVAEYRLPDGIEAVTSAFDDRIAEQKSATRQTATLVFDPAGAAKEVGAFLADQEPQAASHFAENTPEGLYAAGMADFFEGRREEAKERLASAVNAYIARQGWEREAPPRYLQDTPPWPLRAEAALWVLTNGRA